MVGKITEPDILITYYTEDSISLGSNNELGVALVVELSCGIITSGRMLTVIIDRAWYRTPCRFGQALFFCQEKVNNAKF
jgi:hypothetical protein